jgi:hypothetical protein
MLHLNERGVNVFINKYKSFTNEAYWNNYDLIIWKKNNNGFFNIKGMFNKAWGIADTVSVDNKGMWVLPKQYVKYFK